MSVTAVLVEAHPHVDAVIFFVLIVRNRGPDVLETNPNVARVLDALETIAGTSLFRTFVIITVVVKEQVSSVILDPVTIITGVVQIQMIITADMERVIRISDRGTVSATVFFQRTIEL